MANLRTLVKRRKAIRNIRKITRTMELIATGRFKKALDRALEADAYTKKIGELAADLTKNAGGDVSHPLLVVRPVVKKALILVLTANRGLAGGYNGGILREAMTQIKQLKDKGIAFDIEVSGKRGQSYFKFQQIPTTASYNHFEEKPKFEEVDVLASKYIDLYVSGAIDQLIVVYQKFQTVSRQAPVAEVLLHSPGGFGDILFTQIEQVLSRAGVGVEAMEGAEVELLVVPAVFHRQLRQSRGRLRDHCHLRRRPGFGEKRQNYTRGLIS